MKELNTYIIEKLHLNKNLKDKYDNIAEQVTAEIIHMLDLQDDSKEYDVILKWATENEITNVIGYIKDDYDFTIFTEEINNMKQSKIDELREYYNFDDKYFKSEFVLDRRRKPLYNDNSSNINIFEKNTNDPGSFLLIRETTPNTADIIYIIFHGNPYGTLG